WPRMCRGGGDIEILHRQTVIGYLGKGPHTPELRTDRILHAPTALRHVDVSHLDVHRRGDVRLDKIVLSHVRCIPGPLLKHDLDDVPLHSKPLTVAEKTIGCSELLDGDGVFPFWGSGSVPNTIRSDDSYQLFWYPLNKKLGLMPCGEVISILGPPVQPWGHADLRIVFSSRVRRKLVQGHISPKKLGPVEKDIFRSVGYFPWDVFLAYELQDGLRGVKIANHDFPRGDLPSISQLYANCLTIFDDGPFHRRFNDKLPPHGAKGPLKRVSYGMGASYSYGGRLPREDQAERVQSPINSYAVVWENPA